MNYIVLTALHTSELMTLECMANMVEKKLTLLDHSNYRHNILKYLHFEIFFKLLTCNLEQIN